MPPPDYGDPLSAREISDIEKWIRDGAQDPRTGKVVREIDLQAASHWAFQPLPKSMPSFGEQNPIDYYVDRLLKEKKLKPTPIADRSTLVRRATFDLTGLPPTPEQMELGKSSFDQLLVELLASPGYGERWARHWLDVARYSDAKDGVLMYGDARIRPFAYTYRDYVIKAFNQDLPFDDFVRHQLAADQMDLPKDSPHLAALGFLTLGRMFDLNRHDVIDDQIDVVTRGFLGMTASCARCHDHKFDPIPTADYYSLYGVFASTIEPLERPRISDVTKDGEAFEKELQAKLDEIESLAKSHYKRTLETARNKTTEYLVHVATTEPDYAETTIFFKSLIPGQLRPQMVHRWRKLIAKRAHDKDPLFAPWHDLNLRFNKFQIEKANDVSREQFLNQRGNQLETLVDQWNKLGCDKDLIVAIEKANPFSPEEIARAYGDAFQAIEHQKATLEREIARLESEILAQQANHFDLADVVAGGNGFGTGNKGNGIHPATGEPTSGKAGFISIPKLDELIPVKSNPLVDGVFVPRSGKTTISTTGIRLVDLPPSSGQTWDYFKFGLSSGTTEHKIGEVDYSISPNTVMAMHANKGITFDLNEFRKVAGFTSAKFRAVLGNSGALGQSQIDFFVFVDGKKVMEVKDFAAQNPGKKIELELKASDRFLTLIAMEGKQGISHDQVVLGNPMILFERKDISQETRNRTKKLERQLVANKTKLQLIAKRKNDNTLQRLLSSETGPIWFPIEEVEYYLSRQDRDRFRGLLNQVDAIAVRHASAADRAMVIRDRSRLVDPVIFQRGDPAQRGTPVVRRSLSVLDSNSTPFKNGSGRLELAESIVSENNPLTARVWVNRVWMHHFGEPLVTNPSDFGLQTERPIQKDLLDFLAATFTRNGWKTKPLHRLIMSSQTYRRSSRLPQEAEFQRQLQLDPENKYFWKANRRRLDLEQMRDAMLFSAGALDKKMYGRPQLITDINNHRRTIYAFVERQNLPDIVQTFDSANADSSTARRPKTTVPQQALYAMNSAFVIEQAEKLAVLADKSKAKTGKDSVERQINWLYQRVLNRSPSPHELKVILPEAKRNGIQSIAQVLLISNEFMFID